MEHSEFVEKYNSNEIVVNVDRNKAGFMYQQQNLMPQNLRGKQALLRTLGFGGIILGIVLFFFAPWWIATGILILSFFTFPQAQKNAAQGVLIASLSDPLVYEYALNNQVLTIKQNA